MLEYQSISARSSEDAPGSCPQGSSRDTCPPPRASPGTAPMQGSAPNIPELSPRCSHRSTQGPQSSLHSIDLAFSLAPGPRPEIGQENLKGPQLRALTSGTVRAETEAATRKAPTFRREEAAPLTVPAVATAAAAPHAQRQQERHQAQLRRQHPRRLSRHRAAAAAAAAAAYRPRRPRLRVSAGARGSPRCSCWVRFRRRRRPHPLPLPPLPSAAPLARRQATAALTGADPERLRRSPRDGP
ncbi:hypothetical protein NN561_016676 [Cricetulus griseus]